MIKEIKVTLLGDSGVGKSSIVNRFCFSKFNDKNKVSPAADYFSKEIQLEGNIIKFQMWDTAGQEQFRSLVPLYLRNSQVAIIVYDITQKSSFIALKEWIINLEQVCSRNLIFILVGNKCDLIDQEAVTYDEAKQYSYQLQALFQYTSCKTNDGIEDLFRIIAGEYLKQEEELKNQQNTNHKQNSKLSIEKNYYSSCC
ncbi:unnamed protein product [Paramecium sonneborni]|uniref:Uncharacterized protein n=1 Tax=Paramecium sonneborni TaxID=65129 RepID=A0A8S1LAH4_9CILI|nr:unnamed protein product [Paramecium sonneborni]